MGGVLEPGGDVGGEAAADDDVDGGGVVDGDEQGLGSGEEGLGAGAGWEDGRVKIKGAAAGEDVEGRWATEANDGLAGADVNHGGDVAGEGGL